MNDLAVFSSGVFDHVGVAVRSIRDVAGNDVETVPDAVQRVTVAFVDLHGLRVELIEPLGESSPIANSLGSGHVLLHLCFRVPRLDRALAEGRRLGMRALTRPVPAPAFGGRSIVWVFSAQLGLIELVEDTPVVADGPGR